MDNKICEVRELFCLMRRALGCYVCKKVYTNPWTVPCGHSYCQKCIKTLFLLKLNCPQCLFFSVTCYNNIENKELQNIICQFQEIEKAFGTDFHIDISMDCFERSFEVDYRIEKCLKENCQVEDSLNHKKSRIQPSKNNSPEQLESKNYIQFMQNQASKVTLRRKLHAQSSTQFNHFYEKEDTLAQKKNLNYSDHFSNQSEYTGKNQERELKKQSYLQEIMENELDDFSKNTHENSENGMEMIKCKPKIISSRILSSPEIKNVQKFIKNTKKKHLFDSIKTQESFSDSGEMYNQQKVVKENTSNSHNIKKKNVSFHYIGKLNYSKDVTILPSNKNPNNNYYLKSIFTDFSTSCLKNKEKISEKETKYPVSMDWEIKKEVVDLVKLKEREVIQKRKHFRISESEMTTEIIDLEKLSKKAINVLMKENCQVSESEMTTEILDFEKLNPKKSKISDSKE